MIYRTEKERNHAFGKTVGGRAPWVGFDVSDTALRQAISKARGVSEGRDKYGRDEVNKILAFFLRRRDG